MRNQIVDIDFITVMAASEGCNWI